MYSNPTERMRKSYFKKNFLVQQNTEKEKNGQRIKIFH